MELYKIQYGELPFCLMLPFNQADSKDVARKEEIMKSIEKLSYKNYKVVTVNEDETIDGSSANSYFHFK
jgi:septum formation inhibitor-activating ATPase MinD